MRMRTLRTMKAFLRNHLGGIIHGRNRKVCRKNCRWLWLAFLCLILGMRHCFQRQKSKMKEMIFRESGWWEGNGSVKVLPHLNTTLKMPFRSCQYAGKNALGIILVPTKAENRLRRELIRTTWASRQYGTNIMVFFFSGRPKSGDLRDLEAEGKIHGDLIVEDMEDTYYALTIKTLRILKWFLAHCPQSSYLIKADDDVFVNIHRLQELLKIMLTDHPEILVSGRVIKAQTPHLFNPFSKWYTPPEMWPPDAVPPNYLGGPFYIIKGEIVAKILEVSLRGQLYHLEDVFTTGLIASQKLKLELHEFPGVFDPMFPSLWYFSRKVFDGSGSHSNTANLITSLHTDGDPELMRQIYRDLNYN